MLFIHLGEDSISYPTIDISPELKLDYETRKFDSSQIQEATLEMVKRLDVVHNPRLPGGPVEITVCWPDNDEANLVAGRLMNAMNDARIRAVVFMDE